MGYFVDIVLEDELEGEFIEVLVLTISNFFLLHQEIIYHFFYFWTGLSDRFYFFVQFSKHHRVDGFFRDVQFVQFLGQFVNMS